MLVRSSDDDGEDDIEVGDGDDEDSEVDEGEEEAGHQEGYPEYC